MNLHVIIGEDDFLVSETAKKLIGDAGPGLEVVDSRNATNEDLQLKDLVAADASFSTPPFLDPVKVTWWRNVGFLPSGGKGGPGETVKQALEKFARKLAANPLPENQKFILSAPKLLQTSVFAKTLKPAAEFAVFSDGKPWERANAAAARAADLAADAGISFAPGALEAFVARVGTDTRSLMSEIGKLRDWLGAENRPVTSADVAEISSQGVGVEPSLWAVTDALGARDFTKAVEALKPFEGQDGFAVLATTVIEKFFRQLAELKDAQAKGKAALATEGMAPFAARKNLGFLRNWSLFELRAACRRFLLLREKAVSSSGGADVLILVALANVCRRPPGGGAK